MAPRPLQVVVLGDVSCPWCYISKRRLSKAMSICAQASFEVHWVPFSWGPSAPKEGVSKWEYLTGVVGAQKLQELFPVASKAYEKEGLRLTLEGLTGCNMDAHRLLAWAADRYGRRRAWDLLEGIYNAYHCQGLYVGSSPEGHVNLLAAAERAGLPRAEAAAVLTEPGVYAEHVQSDMAAHKGVKAIPRVEIAGRLRLSGCKTVEQYVTAIRAALRDMEDEQAPAAGSPRCARQREEVAAAAGTARLPQLHSAPCSPWPSAGALRPQPQPRSGSPAPQAQLPSQPKPQAQQAPPHPPQQPPSPQARPQAATGSPPRCQAQAPGPGAGSGSGPGPKRASPSLTSAATRSPAANPLQQLLQAHAAAAATTSRFQRSSSGPHMLHYRTLTGGGGGGGVGDGGTAGGGRPQQASGLSTTRRQFGSGLHADCSAHAGTEVLQVRVTAAPGVESDCPSASAPVTWMDSVEPMSPTEGVPSGGASAGIEGAGAGSGGRGGGRTPGAFAKSSDGGVTGGGCAAAASPRTRMARVSSDRDGPGSAGAASYSSPVRGAYGVMDVAVEDVSSPVGSAAEQQQQQPRRYRRPPAKGKSLLQLVRSDLAAGAGAGGGGGGGVLVGGDRAERVESAVQVLQLLHSNLLGGGGASSGSSGGGGGRDVSPSSRSLLAGRLGVGGSSNRVRVGATDREGALIATALQRKTFRERAVASSDGTTDVFPQPGMLGSPGEDGGVGGGGMGRLGRAAAMAVRAAGGGGGGGDGDRSAAVTSPGGPTAGGSGPTLKHGPTGRSLLGVGSTSSHHHLHHHYQHPHQHSPQRAQYDRSGSLGLGGGVSPSGGSGVSPSGGGAGSDSGSTGAGAGGLANSAPGPPTRFSCNGGAALIPSMVGGAAAAVATVGSGGQVVGGAGVNRSQSPGNQVLHVSPSGRLPATQEAGGRAADAVGAAPPHFASGPLTLAAAPPAPPAGGATSTSAAAAAAAAMPPPVRLVLDTAAFAGGRGAAAGSSDGRDSQGVPPAHTGGLSAVALSPGGGASSRLVSASRSPSGAPPSPAALSFTQRLALSEVTAVTSLLSGSPRAGGTAGAAGPAATLTPSPPHSHASNKVAPAPVTISVSARLPEVAAAPSGPAPQRPLSRSSAPAVAQPASPQPLQPQPPSQPQALQPPQPAGSKPAGRVVTLTGTRAVGAASVPLVAGPSSQGTGSGWAGAPGPAAGAAANGESRTTSGNSSIGDGASSAGGSRRKLKSFLPPLLARLFG